MVAERRLTWGPHSETDGGQGWNLGALETGTPALRKKKRASNASGFCVLVDPIALGSLLLLTSPAVAHGTEGACGEQGEAGGFGETRCEQSNQ